MQTVNMLSPWFLAPLPLDTPLALQQVDLIQGNQFPGPTCHEGKVVKLANLPILKVHMT